MRQILQCLRSGETSLVEIPQPRLRRGTLLIETMSTLVSIGTERMLVDFGRSNFLNKARQQPEKVRQVIDKIKNDGLAATVNAVNAKLDQSIPLGYCNVGRVSGVGEDVKGFVCGDVVVSNGPHAEYVLVETNLCAKIPASISTDDAVFTVVGAIALQGIRLLKPTLGECFVVTGLGLIGLLAVQILIANGCRVIGIDFDSGKCDLARQFGADTVDLSAGEDPLDVASELTGGRGVDGVLITASTRSNDPVHQGAQMCRKRGRIVLVGVTGLELSRDDFYEKELSFQVSCSYGPGRYDSEYESKGNDYPFGFVRWTEQRNFEAVLGLMERGKIDVKSLISHRFAFEDSLLAYESMSAVGILGVVLHFGNRLEAKATGGSPKDVVLGVLDPGEPTKGSVGLIGAGGFTRQVLLPALIGKGVRLKSIVSSKGVSGTQLGQKFGFEISTTDPEIVFGDNEIDTLVITTRHNMHAKAVLKGLEAGKRVYVEKPLCIHPDELDAIVRTYRDLQKKGREPFLMVGFNRRFAPQVIKLKTLISQSRQAKAMTMIVNAGRIPGDHWAQDQAIGGGRIIGEACHFIDLLRFLADSPIASVQSAVCGAVEQTTTADTVTIVLRFEDGSTGTIQYLANGHKSVSKERLEIYSGGKIAILDNYRRMKGYGWNGFRKMNLWRQDKGHKGEMEALVGAIKDGKGSPIPFEEIIEVTSASFEAAGLLNDAK